LDVRTHGAQATVKIRLGISEASKFLHQLVRFGSQPATFESKLSKVGRDSNSPKN